jgi:hypothetical protein
LLNAVGEQMMSLEQQLSIEEGRALIYGGLGKYELELVISFCAPLAWTVRNQNGDIHSRNGTVFFLDVGEGTFAVTACHVIDGWRQSTADEDAGPLRVAGNGYSVQLDWDARVIDAHAGIDIATFRIDRDEVRALGKSVLTGFQKQWPPDPPVERGGIYYCGYPGVGTRQHLPREVIFGAAAGYGEASSVSEKDVSTLIERERLIPLLGSGVHPENFDFGGISGGIMLMILQNQLRSWALAGVIYQGPNTSENPEEAITGLEIIKARRAHFILPNGRLDTVRWNTLSL